MTDCKHDNITREQLDNFVRFFTERKKFARENRVLFNRLLSYGFNVSLDGIDYSPEEI